MSDLLKTLNFQQKQAVIHQDGPLLIIAGAGTGKTTVITYKIAWLIEQKLAKPDEVLALTFTDKAAGEMEERVDKLLPYGVFDMWISTFHSFCDRILQNHALDIGLAPDYRLLNTTESWLLLRENLYKLNLDYYRPRGNPTKFIHALIKLFSRLKDENITPEEYLKYADDLIAGADATMSDQMRKLETKRIKETADCFFQYQQLLLDNNFLDFGDLIYYTNKLFVQRPNILQEYQKQFKYILVDEFQDTNLAQYQLIKHLANSGSNLTVVGDDDQAIYKFRGASVSNILNFKKDFPNSKEIVLTKNYRSSQNILDLAYNFIQHNNPDRLEYQLNKPDKYYQQIDSIKAEKISKKLSAQNSGQGHIEFLSALSSVLEVEIVLNKIKELLKHSNVSYNDIAILSRTNRAAEPFVGALEQRQIPYIYLTNYGLYKQAVIIDLLSYVRILGDRADSISLSHVLSMPSVNVDIRDLSKINYWRRRKAQDLYKICENIRRVPDISEQTVRKIETLIFLVHKHSKQSKILSAVEVFRQILVDLKYREYLLSIEKKHPYKAAQDTSFINQLIRKIESYSKLYNDKSLNGFIRHIDMEREAGDSGILDQELAESGPEAIKVLTIHAAKGLEFKYVFLVKLVDHHFPAIGRSDPIELPADLITKKEILPEGDEHLEEERRLFYVALTRAKEGLFLTAARNYSGKRDRKASRFLVEAGIINDVSLRELTPKNEFMVDKQFLLARNELGKMSAGGKLTGLQLPSEFSYSQIAAFRKCPLQYKYQFILKIPQDKGKASFSFGRTMHNTMFELFKRIKMRVGTAQTSLFGEAEQSGSRPKSNLITLDEIYQIYQEKWIDDWYDSAESKKHYYQAGKKILKNFYERHQNSWPIPIYLEHPFQLNVEGYIFKGRIDRIDKIKDNIGNSGIEIIDYKTGKCQEKLYGDDKIQLLIYQMALEKNEPGPKKLTYYYLNEQKPGEFSFLGTREEITKAKQSLIKTVEQIKKSDFPALSTEFNCKFCDFQNICPDSAI